MEPGQVMVYRRHEVVVDAGRNVVWVEGGLERRRVAAGAGEEEVALHLSSIGGRERVAKALIGAEHGLKGGAAHLALAALQEARHVVALGKLHLLAMLVAEDRQLEVGVVEQLEDVLGGVADLTGLCEKPLHL